jgi:hypothetical protein
MDEDRLMPWEEPEYLNRNKVVETEDNQEYKCSTADCNGVASLGGGLCEACKEKTYGTQRKLENGRKKTIEEIQAGLKRLGEEARRNAETLRLLS